ncbi:hypothetical protein M3J09_011755 [Ascochyta lentis]
MTISFPVPPTSFGNAASNS